MNLLKRFKSLFAEKPIYTGILVATSQWNYTVNLFDGTGTVLCTPNTAYKVGDSVTVQGNSIIGTAPKVDTMLQFEV